MPRGDLSYALADLPPGFREALEFSRDQIMAYHRTQVEEETRHEREGIVIRNLVRPVDRAGCYVPGGRAVYPSTVLMTAIPAQVAGVPEIALCVPPGPDGAVPPGHPGRRRPRSASTRSTGSAAPRPSPPWPTAPRPSGPVDVIVGPGNVYVTLAKREVAGVVGIEATAGPSELVVVADESAPPDYVAIDLMAQAEHGPDGAALLVTWSESLAADVVDRRSTGCWPSRPAGPTPRRPCAAAAPSSSSTGPSRPWTWPTSSPPSTSSS